MLPDDIQAIQTGTKKMTDILDEKKRKYEAKYRSTQTAIPTITTPVVTIQTQILPSKPVE